MIGIYGRQSLDKKDSLSIESQIEKCIALCDYNNWNYSIYKDKGFSGKDLNRPGFQKLMNDIKSGKVKKIICYRLDRISRSMADFSNLIVELENYNCEFISATENFDTSTPLGRAMVNIIMTFAQLERETVIERVTDNYYYRAALGHWGGGPAPYGYTLEKRIENGKKYTVLKKDEYEAPIVKKIFETYLKDGNSTADVLNMLEIEKIGSRGNVDKKSSWTKRIILTILRRAAYTQNNITIYNYFKQNGTNIACDIDLFDGTKSVFLYGKTNKNVHDDKTQRMLSEQYLTVTEHEPIIDSATWLMVQRKIGTKRTIPPRTGTSKLSVYTGLMYCGNCHCRCTTKPSKRGNRTYEYYVCNSKKTKSKYACISKPYKKSIIDYVINEDFAQHVSEESFKKRVINAKVNLMQEIKPKEINDIELEIARIDSEISNLIASIAKSGPTITKYIEDRVNILDDKKKLLLNKMSEIEHKNNSSSDKYTNIINVLNNYDDLNETIKNGDFEDRKLLANLLIDKITITSDTDIKIDYVV